MSRLIDADSLVRNIKKCEKYIGKYEKDIPYDEDIYVSIMMTIEDEPTVDAVPVKKGEWLPMYCSSVFGGSASAWGSSIAGYMCSECDEEIGTNDDYDYCPYCGSRNVKKDD